MQAFQEFLRDWMARGGWSNADLARATGIDGSNIGRWFGPNPKRPSEENLRKLAAVLDVPHADLMRMAGRLEGEPTRTTSPADPLRAELRARLSALEEMLAPYPRAFWSTRLALMEQIAQLPDAPQPPISAPAAPAISAPMPAPKRANNGPRQGTRGALESYALAAA